MPTTKEAFPCWLVTQNDSQEKPSGGVAWIQRADLPAFEGESTVIEVEFSSLNYKDALACGGHRGVIGSLPHVPGIDCAGTVVETDGDAHRPGDRVLVTGYDLGAACWGGFSAFVRVPASWPVALEDGLTPREAMLYGTAGFTAAQCVTAIVDRVPPDAGEVLVTGATGGVGVYAVALLAKLGYRVVAVTGKPDRESTLRQLGASEVVGRDALQDDGKRPLLSERWAAAVDTVGGAPLANVIRSTAYRGVVAACGLVAGDQLPLSVYPFLLRGVTLAGIDSAKCPREPRLEIWRRLAGNWRVELPAELVTTVTLDGLPVRVAQILAGGVAGRTLVRPVTEND